MRRLIRVLGAIAVGLLVVGAVLWFGWLPHYRPELHSGERYGVDVSHHQGVIDWQSVADDNISFAYIKATEGEDFVDTRFEQNWRDSDEAGLARGAYHFFTFCAPGEAQASNFLSRVPQDATALPPAVDVELAGNCSRRPTPQELRVELTEFMASVEARTDRRVVMYVGDDAEDLYGIRSWMDRPVWELRFLRRPTGQWFIWQVMGFADVEGIEGDVDLDVMAVD